MLSCSGLDHLIYFLNSFQRFRVRTIAVVWNSCALQIGSNVDQLSIGDLVDQAFAKFSCALDNTSFPDIIIARKQVDL